jgi:hypothetical protein
LETKKLKAQCSKLKGNKDERELLCSLNMIVWNKAVDFAIEVIDRVEKTIVLPNPDKSEMKIED